ncbi:MAG: hypothetical protein JWQ49_4276 [Edaphobacter sp.]|nr:hypothetical protein [Edaphobacter sp.]
MANVRRGHFIIGYLFENFELRGNLYRVWNDSRPTRTFTGAGQEPNLGLRIRHSQNLSHAYVATY